MGRLDACFPCSLMHRVGRGDKIFSEAPPLQPPLGRAGRGALKWQRAMGRGGSHKPSINTGSAGAKRIVPPPAPTSVQPWSYCGEGGGRQQSLKFCFLPQERILLQAVSASPPLRPPPFCLHLGPSSPAHLPHKGRGRPLHKPPPRWIPPPPPQGCSRAGGGCRTSLQLHPCTPSCPPTQGLHPGPMSTTSPQAHCDAAPQASAHCRASALPTGGCTQPPPLL